MLEKTVETYLVDRVRAAGGDAYKFSSPARVSVPDRIVVFPPARIYFVELKRPGGKPTRGQEREHARLRALGCDVRVIDSREGVDAFVQKVHDGLISDDRALLVEAWKFGQFDDDFDVSQAKPIRAALRRMAAALAQESLISESVIKDSASKVSQATDAAALGRRSATAARALAAPYGAAAAPIGIVHRPAPNGDDFSVAWRTPPAAGALYAASQPAGFDNVRSAVEQGLWAADVKLTDDAWQNIEAILTEQARVDAIKAARAGGAA